MKKTLSFTLALLLLLLLVPFSALADGDMDVIPVGIIIEKPELDEIVTLLNIGGFFRGTNNGYELDRAPTRAEAAVAFVRMLGKDEWAQANVSALKAHPFTDVPSWANPQVAYMYDAGLTQGVSATAFGSSSTATATQFYTFVLRALGYTEGEGKDFIYTEAIDFAKRAIITDGVAASGDTFLRGDMAVAMYECLMATPVGSDAILIRKMADDGVIPAYIADLFEGENEIYNFMQEVNAASADMTSMTLAGKIKIVMSASGVNADMSAELLMKIIASDLDDMQMYMEMTLPELLAGADTSVKTYTDKTGSYSFADGQWKKDLSLPSADISGLMDISAITSLTGPIYKDLLANTKMTRKDGKVELVYSMDISKLLGLLGDMIGDVSELDAASIPIGDITLTLICNETTHLLESMKMAFDMDMGEDGKASVTADFTVSDYNKTTITLDKALQDLIAG